MIPEEARKNGTFLLIKCGLNYEIARQKVEFVDEDQEDKYWEVTILSLSVSAVWLGLLWV